jgi:hypothetical protein
MLPNSIVFALICWFLQWKTLMPCNADSEEWGRKTDDGNYLPIATDI